MPGEWSVQYMTFWLKYCAQNVKIECIKTYLIQTYVTSRLLVFHINGLILMQSVPIKLIS